MGDDLPAVPGESAGLPTLSEAIANWLGFQLPSIPMPQTVKNVDKAVGQVLLAAGENAAARIKANTGKQKAKGKIEIEGMYRTEEEKRKLENRAASVKGAIDELNEKPSQQDATQEIDDDWLNLYAKLAEDKSSEELRSLFGKILAGEIRKPGTFSLRTLQFVSALSREEADKITNYFKFVLAAQAIPTFAEVDGDRFLTFQNRLLMHELGIVSSPSVMGGLEYTVQVKPSGKGVLLASDYAISIINNRDILLEASFGCQALTVTGQELYAIAATSLKAPVEYLKEVANLIYHQVRAAGSEGDLRLGNIKVEVVKLAGEATETVYTASGDDV
ncbi:DUF2806 domain-containing protein [Bradyrhizobium sp. 1]|uniref:DUF2806 domain-containing protein n=1 Tax=Bradyrhizobium sp. 1 TaxID=241591 RepID=UPI001FF8DAC6|nr:DUF2806 domain-containing protein [Bradyrhizobium sp. 1]MCK1391621.1 DUF2806 domain-containing protein [Bradyrhizobium sp. 1]